MRPRSSRPGSLSFDSSVVLAINPDGTRLRKIGNYTAYPLSTRLETKLSYLTSTVAKVLRGGSYSPGERGVGVLPRNRLMRMCCWMGSHFHDWIDYNGVAFSIELLEWGRIFSGFRG